MTSKAPKELNAITDIVLAYRPPKSRLNLPPEPPAYSISVEKIFSDARLRLDAAYFDPDLDSCLKNLEALDLPLEPLSSLAELFLPNRFERVWADDEEHGIPYLNATDLLSLFAIGTPGKMRYLSRNSNVEINSLVVRRDWLLMTCSGTIGRIFHVPERLDGWVATHDLIRVVPKSGMTGYLFAWCMTESARTQVIAHAHGGQIDHVTHDQVGSMLVPILPENEARALDRSVLHALRTREKGLRDMENLWPRPV